MQQKVWSLEDFVGNTPMLKLRRWRPGGATLCLKLEQFNPGGSIKDRVALAMLRDLEEHGAALPGARLVEASTGNTAIALAMFGVSRRYSTIAVCDSRLSTATKRRLLALGATVVLVPTPPSGISHIEACIAVAEFIARNIRGVITPRQFASSANSRVHYETTGPEITRDVGDRVDVLVCSIGTGGSISGVGRFLRERNPAIRILGVTQDGCIPFAAQPRHDGANGVYDETIVDEIRSVADTDAIQSAREIAATEGLLLGGSGALVAHVSGSIAQELPANACVVGIVPDAGERYLDTFYNFAPSSDQPAASSDLSDIVSAIGCSVNGRLEQFSVGALREYEMILRRFGEGRRDSAPQTSA